MIHAEPLRSFRTDADLRAAALYAARVHAVAATLRTATTLDADTADTVARIALRRADAAVRDLTASSGVNTLRTACDRVLREVENDRVHAHIGNAGR